MPSAVIRIGTDDAESIVRSMGPEAGRDLPRTRTDVRYSEGIGIITVTASDTSALRAALNSHLECIRIAQDIGKITR